MQTLTVMNVLVCLHHSHHNTDCEIYLLTLILPILAANENSE